MSDTGRAKDYDMRRRQPLAEPNENACKSCNILCRCGNNTLQQLTYIEPNVVKRLPLIRPISAKTTPRPKIKLLRPYKSSIDKLPPLIKTRGIEAFEVNK